MAAGAWTETQLGGTRKVVQTADATVATRFYQSLTTDPVNDTEYDVLKASGSVKVGDFYGPNTFLRVQSVTVSQSAGNPLQWFITVVFSTRVPEDSDEIIPDPIARPPEFEVVQIKSTEPMKVIPDFFNRDGGNPIVPRNSAGVPYDPPIEREITDFAIRVVQNFKEFEPNDITGFTGVVNSEVWETFDRGQCRIANIGYVRLTQNGITYWERSVEIHVRAKTDDYSWDTIYPWQVLRENVGVQQMDIKNEEVEPIPYAGFPGVHVREYVGLTLLGRAQPKSAQPTFERWDVYDKKDFAVLDIRLR